MALAPLAQRSDSSACGSPPYQSVSGAGGARARGAGARRARRGLDGDPPPRAGGDPPFAFNVVPQIDRFEDNGYTREEMKIVWETRKILDLPDLAVTATAVRVPVRVGHAAALHVSAAAADGRPPRRGATGRRRRASRWSTSRRAHRYPTPLVGSRTRRGAGGARSPRPRRSTRVVVLRGLRTTCARAPRPTRGADRRATGRRDAHAARADGEASDDGVAREPR